MIRWSNKDDAEPSLRRKWIAALLVFAMLAGVHRYISYRSRPPSPAIEFPKDLKDLPP